MDKDIKSLRRELKRTTKKLKKTTKKLKRTTKKLKKADTQLDQLKKTKITDPDMLEWLHRTIDLQGMSDPKVARRAANNTMIADLLEKRKELRKKEEQLHQKEATLEERKNILLSKLPGDGAAAAAGVCFGRLARTGQ